MKISLWFVMSLAFTATSCSKKSAPSSKKENLSYQVVFYNVENLFDTINQEGVNDGEFTPESKKAWNSEKYQVKLDHIEQVLSSIDSNGQIACIGLSEVENRTVLEDLVQKGFLRQRNFKIEHFESPDFRGIDVAFLYNPQLIKPISSKAIYVNLQDSNKTTRDILKVKVQGPDSQEMLMYINHWPSRWGGTEQTNAKRVNAASTLRRDLNEELAKDSEQQVIIMGDLNDYPDNESVFNTLEADSVPGGFLYNATWEIHKDPNLGTHNYKNHWGVLDQMIISNNLISQVDSVYPFKENFMLYETKKGDWLPSRTYSGSNYFGGYSDHLPIVLKMKKSK